MSSAVGVLLPSRELAMYPPGRGDPRLLVDAAVRAEELGFDSAWVGDSILAKPRADPLVVLAAAATATHRIVLGTAVLLAAMRRPEQMAQQVATVDALAGGRFVLGVGGGPSGPAAEADFALAGADFGRRGRATVDVVDRARQLWRGGGVARDAERLQPVPVSDNGPQVWMGGAGPLSRRRAGQLFDGWFPLATDSATYRSGVDEVRQAAATAGRPTGDVTAAAYLTVTIGTSDTARRELADHAQRYYGQPVEVVGQQMGMCAGTEEVVATWLRRFVDAGCQHLCLRLASADFPTQLERLAGLLPTLRPSGSTVDVGPPEGDT